MSLSHKAMLACFLGTIVSLPVVVADAFVGAATPDAPLSGPTEDKRKTLMAEATSAISETLAALRHLDEGKSTEALKDLERASGKLHIILAREPKLRLAPAALTVVTQDLDGGIDTAKRVRRQAEDLLNEGRLQEARHLLQTLASETVISVSNIPLATYPDAITKAVTLIDNNKLEAAKQVLQTALNTQVITETIIPLPIANAQEALSAAESLAKKKDRSVIDSEELKADLDRARQQLEFAQALGYGTKNDFERMYQQLNAIEEKIASNRSGKGWFADIKDSLAKFIDSQQAPKP